MKKNNSFIEKCKERSRNAFTKIGNMAVGNPGNVERESVPVVTFSNWPFWLYETKMPKRKSK